MTTVEIDLLLSLFSFGLGVSTRFNFAFRLTIFMLQVIDWWIKSHPKGQQMAFETQLDEEFYRLFGVEMKQYPHLFSAQPRKKPGPKPKLDKEVEQVI